MTRRWALAVLLIAAACSKSKSSAPVITVALSPSGTTYTNASVLLTATVSPANAKVTLLRDGAPIATVTPPYSYILDTSTLPEGPTAIVAEASVGGSKKQSTPTTVVVDRTPPTVVSLSPLPYATNVWSRDLALATFSEPLRASSVFDGGVSLQYGAVGTTSGGAALPGAKIALQTGGQTVAIRVGPLAAVPGQVTVDLSGGITDRAGNPLTLPSGAWTWTIPKWQDSPAVSLLEAGTPFSSAAMVGTNDTFSVGYALGNHVYAQHLDGSTWNLIGFPQAQLSGDPILAMNMRSHPGGGPAMAWVENAAGYGQTVFVRFWDGEDWEHLADGVPTAPLANACTDISVDLDVLGHPQLAWAQTFSDSDVLWNAWSDLAWKTPVDVPLAATGVQDQPTIALDAFNRAIVAWRDVDGLHAARREGTAFTQLGTVIDGGAGQHARVGANRGEPFVAWDEAGDVHVKQWDGANWVAVGGILDFNAAGTAKDPQIDVDPAGEPTVAWLESDGAPFLVRLAHYDGAQWNALPTITASTAEDVTQVSLALDTGGAPFVTFIQPSGVFARRLNGY